MSLTSDGARLQALADRLEAAGESLLASFYRNRARAAREAQARQEFADRFPHPSERPDTD